MNLNYMNRKNGFENYKSIIELIVVFSFINDKLIVDISGSDVVTKGLFALFILSFLKEIYQSCKTFYGKKIIVFGLLLLFTILGNYQNYESSQLIKSLFILISIVTISLVFYQRVSINTLYFIWFSVIVSIICSVNNDPLHEYTFRKTGGTEDPNEFASHIIVFGLFSILLYSINRSRIILLGMFPLFIVGILNAGSVTSLIVILIVTSSLIYHSLRKSSKTILLLLCGVIIIGIFSQYIGTLEEIQNVTERASNNESNADSRIEAWHAALEMFQDNPLYGVGLGNYSKEITKYSLIQLEEGAGNTAHNILILLMGEGGLFVSLVFIYLLVTSFNKDIFFATTNSWHFYLFLAFLSVLLMGMTLSMTYEKYFWLLFAIQNKSNQQLIYSKAITIQRRDSYVIET